MKPAIRGLKMYKSDWMDTSNKTLLQEYEGVKIYVGNEDGKFYAALDGKVVKKNTLADVQKAVSKTLTTPVKTLLVYDNLQTHNSVRVHEVTTYDKRYSERHYQERYRLVGGGFVDASKGRTYGGTYEHLYFYDEEVFAELQSLQQEQRALGKRWEEIRNKLILVTPDELKARQAEAVEE
jgi:hypothetical protein